MTIKEAEARTGLSRANIRYYEGEGFFTAARGENGYRDYSGENIDILLKVKLLRQLGFSLEDIRDFQRGDQALETALARREEGLGREQAELDRAVRLCRELREDRADFATLDARRYLERLEQEERPETLKEDRFPQESFLWRRAFARGSQYLFWNTLARIVLILLGRRGYSWETDIEMIACGMALGCILVVETLTLHFTGTTPIKHLCGLKIIREDGSFLSMGESFRRTFYVVLAMAFYFYLGFFRVMGDYVAGMIWAAWLFAFWWMRGSLEETEEYLFWTIENEVYLEGSTRETNYWYQKGVTGRALLLLFLDLFGVWFWFASVWF